MPRPPKGDKRLTERFSLMVTPDMKDDLDTLAIQRSKPRAMATASDVAREAIEIGIYALKNDADPRPKKPAATVTDEVKKKLRQ